MTEKTKVPNLFPHVIKDMLHNEKPRFVWEIDTMSFSQLKYLRDEKGEYLWVPNIDYMGHSGKLLGLDIVISDEPGIRLVTIFRKSEHSKLVVLEE